MKRFLPVFLIIVACGGNSETETSVDGEADGDGDSLEIIMIEHIDTTERAYITVNEHLEILLDDPIDLVAFKKDFGPSNGGSRNKNKTLQYPEEEGIVYQYMLFNKLRHVLPSHPDEGKLFNNFRITVYRFGDEIGDFYDSNEELVMIECALDNLELGELNWYGKSRIEIMDRYGAPQFEQDDCLIYTYEHKTITAHLNNGQVDWYKYVKLNKAVDLSEAIPGILLDF